VFSQSFGVPILLGQSLYTIDLQVLQKRLQLGTMDGILAVTTGEKVKFEF